MNFSKVVRVGSVPRGWGKRPDYPLDVFANIEYKDGRLSISGVVGPRSSGNCGGSAGQFIMMFKEYDNRGHTTLATIKLAPGWSRVTVRRFFDAWHRWHLNDMKAGSAAQEQYLKDSPMDPASYAYPKDHYTAACAHLAAAGLNPDADGYKYGHAWKREEVPADVIAFLQSLPETDKTPAWV